MNSQETRPLSEVRPADESSKSAASPTVQSLAMQLHEADGEKLRIAIAPGVDLDLTGEAGVAFEAGELVFASLAERNRIVANATLMSFGEQDQDPAALLDAAVGLWRDEITHADTACGRLLAAVHVQRDVFALATPLVPMARDVFELMHVLEKALPYLQTLDWPPLIAFYEAANQRVRGDGALGAFLFQVQRWLNDHPGSGAGLSAELLGRTLTQESVPLLVAAWHSWGRDDPLAAAQLVLQLPQHDALAERLASGVARCLLGEAALPRAAVSLLSSVVHRQLQAATPEDRRAAVDAATSVMHLRRDFDEALRTLAREADAEVMAYLAFALGQQRKDFLEAGTFFDWLSFCVRVPIAHAGAVHELDYALAPLLRESSTQRDAALDFLQAWISGQPSDPPVKADFAKLFTACTQCILADETMLKSVITRWFLAEDRALPATAAALILPFASSARASRRAALAKLGFDADTLRDATEADLRFLARRLLGFVFNVDLLLVLALSLLRLDDAQQRVHPLMEWLLADEIGYDYPQTTVEQLDVALEVESDEPTKALLQRVRDKVQGWLTALDHLPRLRELEPPADLQRAFRKLRAKKVEEEMRNARKDSIFSQITSQVHLKAGGKSFQFLNERFTEPMTLKPVSFSIEMPRRESLDPVGNAYRVWANRLANREAP